MTKPRVVVCAAVRMNYFETKPEIITGPRHFDETMYRQLKGSIKQNWPLEKDSEQGFIDQYGVFMTREEAWEVACAAGQIRYVLPNNYGRLFSENLY